MFDVEDITEEYGAHGVQTFSIVHNMSFYTVDVRASGYVVYGSDNVELEDDDEIKTGAIKAVKEHMENKNV